MNQLLSTTKTNSKWDIKLIALNNNPNNPLAEFNYLLWHLTEDYENINQEHP